MLKKTWAIVLSLVLILSACPMTGVFADTKPVAITENFDGKTVAEINANITTFNSVPTMEIAAGAGKNGGDALKISALNDTAALGFNSTYTYASDVSVLSYDIQISKEPSTNTQSNKEMVIAGCLATGGNKTLSIKRMQGTDGPEFKLCSYDNAYNVDVAVGQWYRIINVKSSGTTASWALNANGNIVAYQTRTINSNQTGFCLIRGTTNAMNDGEILIDNVEFNVYNAANYGPSLENSSIQTGSTVPTNTNSVTVTFDQPITTKNAALTTTAGNTITCSMTEAVDENNIQLPLTYIVSWTQTLAGTTTYTLDFTGSKSYQNVAVDSTGVVTFTTEEASLGETVLRDNFEDASEFSSNLYDRDYSKPFSSGSTSHGAFEVTGYGNTGSAAEIRYDYSNTSGTRATFYSSSAYNLSADNGVVATYKMKISNAPVTYSETAQRYIGGNRIFIGTNTANNSTVPSGQAVAVIDMDYNSGVHYIGLSSGQSKDENSVFCYEEDKWYNAALTVEGDRQTFTLTDIATGECVFENSKTYDYTKAATYLGLVSIFQRTDETYSSGSAYYNENAEGTAITIDDASLWQIDSTKAAHKLTATAGANENVVSFSFNQPTKVTADMLKVYKGEETNDLVDAEISVVYPNDTNFAANTVTVLGLEPGETYTLDYSGVTSAGGAGFSTGELTTKVITMTAPSVTMMTGADYSANNATVNFWANAGESKGKFIAAFYSGSATKKLVAAAVSDEIDFVAGKNQITIPVMADVADATSLVIYAWDGLTNITPLCAPTASISIA